MQTVCNNLKRLTIYRLSGSCSNKKNIRGMIDDLDNRNYLVNGCKFDAIEKMYDVLLIISFVMKVCKILEEK